MSFAAVGVAARLYAVNSAFVAGLLLGGFVAAQVGPVSLLCIRTSTRSGFRVGVSVGLGAAVDRPGLRDLWCGRSRCDRADRTGPAHARLGWCRRARIHGDPDAAYGLATAAGWGDVREVAEPRQHSAPEWWRQRRTR